MRRCGVRSGTPERIEGSVALGEGQVVGRSQRPGAQVGEVEPGDAGGGPRHGEQACADGQLLDPHRRTVTERREHGRQPCLGLRPERVVVDRQVAQALQPVVDRPVERHHVDLRAAAGR